MRFFHKALHAEQGEGISILLFLLLGMFLGSLSSLTEVTSISLFIKSWNRIHLPLAFLIAGVVALGAAHFYTKLQNWMPVTALAFFSICLLFVGDLFIFYSYRLQPSNPILYSAFVFSFVKLIIVTQIFWGFFYKLYDTLQIRRLQNRIELGFVLGIVITLWSVPALLNEKKIEEIYLFLLSALLTIGAGIIVVVFSFHFPLANKVSGNVQYIQAHNNYTALLQKPYLKSIALFAFVSAMAIGWIDFIFYSIVAEKHETTVQTIGFLSPFFAVITFLGYTLSAAFSEKLTNRYGYRITLLLLPAVISVFVLVYSVISIRFGYQPAEDSFYLLFMLIGICKLLYMVFYKGFEFGTLRAYFIPLETALRFDFQNRVEGVFRQAGRIATAFLALLFLTFFTWEFAHYSCGLFAVCLLWILATFKMHHFYRITLKESLDQRDIIIKKDGKINSYPEELVYSVNKTIPIHLPAHLNILNILDPIKYKKAIELLLNSDNDDAQGIALQQAADLCLLSVIPILEALQKSKFYPICRNRELIQRTYHKLRGAEFRLEKVTYIEQLTFSKIISERRFGALLAAYSSSAMKPKLLNKLFRDPDYKVRYNAVTASALTQTSDLHYNLIEKLAEPAYSNAAAAAIATTGKVIFPLLETAFHLAGQEEKIQLRIIQIYGRIASKEAVEQLTKKLNYTNQNIVVASIDALSRCNITIRGEKSVQLRRGIEEVCQVLVWNMAAYNRLFFYNSSELLLAAMKSEIRANYDALFKLLALLYDPKSVYLVKNNINSGDSDRAEFASELLEVFAGEEIKPMLLPIISVDSYETIVWKMQEYFPIDPMSNTEVLYDLIQRDCKWVNRWTKACALQELVQTNQYKNHDIFIANLVNPDAMLRETSAILLYKMNRMDFKMYTERFKQKFNCHTGKELIPKNILAEITGQEYSPALQIEMIRFLNLVSEFKDVPGIILLEIAKVMELTYHKKGETIDQFKSFDYCDYFFVQEGTVSMKINEKNSREYTKSDFIHALHFINTEEELIIELEALENCSVYKIKREQFHELISCYEEIPKALLAHQYVREAQTETSSISSLTNWKFIQN